MKIMIAQSTASILGGHESYRQALSGLLDATGAKTQALDVPSIDAAGRALTNIASVRLLATDVSADVLICLDPVAAVLEHPRKIVALLDDSFLDSAPVQLAQEGPFERAYVANILRSALDEAKSIFAPSGFASERLRALSLRQVKKFRPSLPPGTWRYARNPGPELLALGNVNDRRRPELLVACLAALPEPFRARWVAPSAESACLARLRDLARTAEVEHRLVIDMRIIDPGETAYLLSQAAAYLDLAPAEFVVGETTLQALQLAVPVICCTDGGALNEISGSARPQSAKPDGLAIAAAVRAAIAVPTVERAQPTTPALASAGWAPLLRAVRR